MGPDKIDVISGTVWSISYSGKPSHLIRIHGLQESSQAQIRRQAKRVAEKYVSDTIDLGLDVTLVNGVDGAPRPVQVSITTWSGDLSFREPSTYVFGPELLLAGLAKINPREFADLGKWLGNQFARAQEYARVQRRGMWAKLPGEPGYDPPAWGSLHSGVRAEIGD